MTGTNVVVAGAEEPGRALEKALGEAGLDARFMPTDGLEGALVELEAELTEHRPAAAVAAGPGEGALALAITAAKLGVPLAVFGAPGSDRADQRRILLTLASLDAGPEPARAAELIAAWIEGP